MLKWIFAGFLISMATLATYLFVHLGFYKSAKIESAQEQSFWLLYKENRGAYHQISPVLDAVEKQAIGASISCINTFALFLDDPNAMAEDRLRSELGCIVAGPVNPPEGLKLKQWAPGEVLHISFDGSPAISPFKVYNLAAEWFQTKRKSMSTETLEIYDLTTQGKLTTHYYFPVNASSGAK